MRKKTILILSALLALFAFSSAVLAVRVGIVTTFPDGNTNVTCVNVLEGATAEDALKATGMRTEWKSYPGFGDFLTRIEDVGCLGSNPSCECENYMECCLSWSFWVIESGGKEWKYSAVGYSGYVVKEGDVVGNIWTGDATKAPQLIKFSQLKSLCPKIRTYRNSKYYGMHTCAAPTVEVKAPQIGSTFENRRVTVEAIGGHNMKRITAIINDAEKILCKDCRTIAKDIIAKIGNNKLQVQVEDYIGRKTISHIIEFLVR